MQFTHLHALIKGRDQTGLVILKSVVLISCMVYIGFRLVSVKYDLLNISTLFLNQDLQFWLMIGFVISLAPLNWFFEVLKWRSLTSQIQQLNIGEAYKSVLAGITFGFATPRAIGDYFGRMLVFNNKNKPRVILPLLVGRISQILPTLLFGLFGIWVLGNNIELETSMIVIPIILLIITLTFLLGIDELKKIGINISTRFGLKNSRKIDFSLTTIYCVISYSFLRYLIFTLQFIIVMLMFEVEAGIYLITAGITWIFFAKSMIPSFSFLSDLGIREFSAILFFEAFQIPLIPVLAAGLFIWLVNIALPAVVGLLSVQSSKI